MSTREYFLNDKDEPLMAHPIYLIECVMALSSFFFGIYLSSPFFQPSLDTPSKDPTFENTLWIRFVTACIFFFLPPAITLISIVHTKWRSNMWRRRASISQFAGWIFITLSQVLSFGFYPVTWVFTLALSLVSAICWLSARNAVRIENANSR